MKNNREQLTLLYTNEQFIKQRLKYDVLKFPVQYVI